MSEQVAPPLGHGRYQLIELLGAGGMALVYKAYDTRLDVPRAVKVLKRELDDLARHRFFNEARTMAKLHHKNVVTVHDVADDGNDAYLVMELIEGGSVADRMAAYGPLPERMACQVGIALLAGLAAAHRQGVVHRDVKPHNILVDSDGTPKVTDFGIAQAAETSTTRTGAVIGTWAYMAPEQRSDAKHVDARADVFGVGCTLYNILTGVDPFDLYNQEVYDQLYAPVPEAWRPLLQRATRYRADDRFPDADSFREALEALLPELPPDPPDTPPLGVSLAGERAAFVPTIMSSGELSSPTLERVGHRPRAIAAPAEPEAPEGDKRLLVAAGAGAVLMVGGGVAAGLGLLGLLALALGLVDAGPSPTPPTAAPPISASAAASDEAGADGSWLAEVPVLEPDAMIEVERSVIEAPRRDQAARAPSGAAAAPQPSRSAQEGRFQVSIEGRPAGTLIEVEGDIRSDRWVGELPAGSYRVRFTNGGDSQQVPVNVFTGMRICYDLDTKSPCR